MVTNLFENGGKVAEQGLAELCLSFFDFNLTKQIADKWHVR